MCNMRHIKVFPLSFHNLAKDLSPWEDDQLDGLIKQLSSCDKLRTRHEQIHVTQTNIQDKHLTDS